MTPYAFLMLISWRLGLLYWCLIDITPAPFSCSFICWS